MQLDHTVSERILFRLQAGLNILKHELYSRGTKR